MLNQIIAARDMEKVCLNVLHKLLWIVAAADLNGVVLIGTSPALIFICRWVQNRLKNGQFTVWQGIGLLILQMENNFTQTALLYVRRLLFCE